MKSGTISSLAQPAHTASGPAGKDVEVEVEISSRQSAHVVFVYADILMLSSYA